jgi:hypothetical protein
VTRFAEAEGITIIREFVEAETGKEWVQEEQARCHNLRSRHRGAAADPGPLVRRAVLDIRAVKSSSLERNVLRIGDVFAL